MSKKKSTDRENLAAEIGERIRSTRQSLGLNQTEFGQMVGVSPNFISEVERGKKMPGTEVMVSLVRHLNVSLDWIAVGDRGADSRNSEDGTVTIPLFLSPVSAGAPHLVDSESEPFRIPQDLIDHMDFFAVRVVGNSMVGAGIRYGDLLLVDRRQEAKRGDIVVAVVDGETCVKRLEVHERKDGHRTLLFPENDEYSPIDITGMEGVVQGVAKRLLRDVH